jgi:uncharacterized protein (DUF2147 family)
VLAAIGAYELLRRWCARDEYGAMLRRVLMSSRVLAATVLAYAVPAPAFADPTGIWLDKDGWTIRIHGCGQALCAEIASTQPALDPATGRPWTDKNNAETSKRDRPLVGVQVLFDMHPNGSGKWSGTLYDPDRGKIYSGNLIELGAERVRIEGCIAVLCGGEELRRVSK